VVAGLVSVLGVLREAGGTSGVAATGVCSGEVVALVGSGVVEGCKTPGGGGVDPHGVVLSGLSGEYTRCGSKSGDCALCLPVLLGGNKEEEKGDEEAMLGIPGVLGGVVGGAVEFWD